MHAITGVLFTVSMVGLGMSMIVHVLALIGLDPGRSLRDIWVFQLALFGLIIPIVVVLFRRRDPGTILRSPRWMKVVLWVLLSYYAAVFYEFLFWSAEHLDSRRTWRMFSAGWLLLFWVAAIFYRVRFNESK